MKYVSSTIIVTFLVVGAIGCGQAGQAAEEPGSGHAPAAPAADALAFSCSEVPSAGFELSHTEATLRNMSSAGKKYPAMVVLMANYDRQGGSYHPNAKTDEQRRVLLNFSAAAGGKLGPGRYALDTNMGEGPRLSIGIEGADASCGLSDGEGFGEITHFDDTTIAGRVSVRDSEGTSIEAAFSTEYGISRY